MNLSKYSKYLNILHTDTLTIKRYIEVNNDDGTTDVVLSDKEELKDIPCRLSTVKEDEHNFKSIDINSSSTKFKVFCDTSVDIKKGDSVIVNKLVDKNIVDTIEGLASKPVYYDIGQEFLVIEHEVS